MREREKERDIFVDFNWLFSDQIFARRILHTCFDDAINNNLLLIEIIVNNLYSINVYSIELK